MEKEYEKMLKKEYKKSMKKEFGKLRTRGFDKTRRKELKKAVRANFKKQMEQFIATRNEMDKIIAGGIGYISFSEIIDIVVSLEKVENLDSSTRGKVTKKYDKYSKLTKKHCFDSESITIAIKGVVTDFNNIVSFERIDSDDYGFFLNSEEENIFESNEKISSMLIGTIVEAMEYYPADENRTFYGGCGGRANEIIRENVEKFDNFIIDWFLGYIKDEYNEYYEDVFGMINNPERYFDFDYFVDEKERNGNFNAAYLYILAHYIITNRFPIISDAVEMYDRYYAKRIEVTRIVVI